MPRKRRNPNPQPGYNRVDLLQAKAPTAAPTGLPYGEHQAVQAQTDAAPLAGNPTDGLAGALAAAQSHPGPNGLTPLGAPSTRPGQPVTAGLPVGAGPGPEALGVMGTAGRRPSVAALLTQIGDDTDSPRIQYLGYVARQMGF